MGLLDGILGGTIDRAAADVKPLLEAALEKEAEILKNFEDRFFDRLNGASITVNIQLPNVEKAIPVSHV